MIVLLNSTYIDMGATAKDSNNIDITENIEVTSNVNTQKVGKYYVKYNVKDSNGNSARQVIRTVEVRDEQSGP